MNLRISLLLICVLSWVSILGVLIYKSDIGKEDLENTSNFFYRVSAQDLTNISITKGSETLSWHAGKDHNWFFDNLDGLKLKPLDPSPGTTVSNNKIFPVSASLKVPVFISPSNNFFLIKSTYFFSSFLTKF